MANGVLYVKYINDNQARNAKGIPVHLWQGVKDYCFLTEGLNLLKIELLDRIYSYVKRCIDRVLRFDA